MPSDDLAQDYVAAPQPTLEELAAKAREKRVRHLGEVAQFNKELDVDEELSQSKVGLFTATQEHDDSFIDNGLEVVGTGIETAQEQVVRSLGDLGSAIGQFAEDLGSTNSHFVWGSESFMGDTGIKVPFVDAKVGFTSGSRFREMRDLYEISTGQKAATLSNFELDDVDRPDSTAGMFAADLVKWVGVFAATRKAMGPGGNVAKGAAAGAVTDFTAFDPHEERLSNLLQTYGEGNPAFDNALTEYLATDKEDSALEGRLKNAMEGLIIGGAIDGLFKAIKWLKARRQQRVAHDFTPGQTNVLDDVVEEADEVKKLDEKSDLNPASVKEGEDASGIATPEKFSVEKLVENVRQDFRFKDGLTDDQVAALARNLEEGNFAEAGKLVQFNEARIDWDSMDEPDAIKSLFLAFEDSAQSMIEKAGGSVVTLKTTKALGDAMDFTVDNVENLFGDLKGNGGLSARMFAAHQTMVASARHLNRLAKAAKASGSHQDKFRLHRHIEMHAAIMGQVKGSQSEIARALSAMRIMKDAAADSFAEFDEVRRLMGDSDDTRFLVERVLASQGDLKQMNRVVKDLAGGKLMHVVSEVAINGLLSSVKTHVINITSNAAMTVIGPMERYFAAMTRLIPGFAKSADAVTFREANAGLVGQFKSLNMAFRMAAKAAKDGKPVSDMRQRIEFDMRKAIRAGEGDNIFVKGSDDTMFQQTVNTLGDIIRLPGRALVVGDEFFKTLNKNAELHALAYREAAFQAESKTFKTAADRAAFVKGKMTKLMAKPSRKMEAEAIQFSRRQTFQEDALTDVGRKTGAMLNSHPLIKLTIAPFFRTPMNLLRQAFVDRNPVFAPMLKVHRDALKRGGADAQMVAARAITGVGAWATAYSLVEGGVLTGKGEAFSNTERLDKIPEYSLKVGDRYIQYNRVDPLGSILGLVADAHYAMTHGYDPNDPTSGSELGELSQAVGLAFMHNAMNKTWMKSMSDLVDMLNTASEGSPASAERAFEKYMGDQAVKYIPFSSAIRGATQTHDPIVREAWTIRDRIYRVMPGLSEELPPMRDMLGREISRANPEHYWWNPFGANPESDNIVDQELAKLAFDGPIIQKNINGVPINSIQFNRFKELMGDFGDGSPTLEAQLKEIIDGGLWQHPETPDGVRVQIVKNLMQARRAAARAMLLQEDDELRSKVLGLKLHEAQQLTNGDLSEIAEELGL